MLALELDRCLGSNVKAHGSAHAPAARKREDASGGSKHPRSSRADAVGGRKTAAAAGAGTAQVAASGRFPLTLLEPSRLRPYSQKMAACTGSKPEWWAHAGLLGGVVVLRCRGFAVSWFCGVVVLRCRGFAVSWFCGVVVLRCR